jgi:hypothetical protein
MKSGQGVQQLTHVTYPKSHMTINDYKAFPSSVKLVVAVMHTNQHYVVMEITINTKIINVFDGSYQLLLDWKDHMITAMRKCMLVDPYVVPFLARKITLIARCGCPPERWGHGLQVLLEKIAGVALVTKL